MSAENTNFVHFQKNKIMETIEFNDYYKDILFSIPLFRDLNTILKRDSFRNLILIYSRFKIMK